MLIAFHTKHIMGAQSLKASLLLRVGFIELGERWGEMWGGIEEGRSWEVCRGAELKLASRACPLAATVEDSATQGPLPIPPR